MGPHKKIIESLSLSSFPEPPWATSNELHMEAAVLTHHTRVLKQRQNNENFKVQLWSVGRSRANAHQHLKIHDSSGELG